MFETNIEKSLKILEDSGIILRNGMSEKEILAAEKCYGIEFPLDYKAILTTVLPFDNEFDENDCWSNFTNWRNLSEGYVSNIKSKMFDWTIDGILYTMEYLGGWLDKWGIQPDTPEEKRCICRRFIQRYYRFLANTRLSQHFLFPLLSASSKKQI